MSRVTRLEDAMNVIKEAYVSVCGVCCSVCGLYRDRKCPGCLKLEGCEILRCARARGMDYCFDCVEFPCGKHTEGFEWDLDEIPEVRESGVSQGVVRWRVYSRCFLSFYRDMKEGGGE